MPVPRNETDRYGIIESAGGNTSNYMLATKVREKPKTTSSNTAIIGRYILNKSIFGILQSQKPGAKGEIQITDAIAQQMNQKIPLYALLFKGKRYDCGVPKGMAEANKDFSKQ